MNLQIAIEWLVENGPGQSAVVQCKRKFGLSALQTAEACRKASELRRQRTGKRDGETVRAGVA